jgi:cytochrome P450
MPAGQRLIVVKTAKIVSESSIADSVRHGAATAFDIRKLSPEFLENPYPTYRALRERDPVHRMPDGSYFLTRYDDCLEVYHDTATWSSDKKVDFQPNFADSLLYEHHTTSLVFNDPPYHTRVRKLLAPAFTPRALRALQARIEELVDRLLDDAAEHGRIDLIADFAAAIPIQLIGDMLGIPQGEREPLREWSLAILGALEPALNQQQFDTGVRAVAEFKDYLDDIVVRRQGNDDSDPAEILSKLIAGTDLTSPAAHSDRMSKLELIHNCIFLLNAGHETTTNLIGNGVDLLIRHPAVMADLRNHPEAVDTAVEEFLRMESSNQLGNRRAAKDAVLGGIEMSTGSYVHIAIGAANRDPAQFPDPDRLDIRRQPNRHLAFGTGIHACAGMSLARMEAQVAIGRLLQRFSRIESAGAFVRSGRARFRGFKSYPVTVTA